MKIKGIESVMSVHNHSRVSTSILPTPIRFVLAGGVAAIVNFGSRILLNFWLPYVVAIVLAYCFGMWTAFLLNRRFVFRGSTSPLNQQIFWFVSVNIIGLAQTLAISLLLFELIMPSIGLNWHARELSHAVGIGMPIITSYLGHRRWTFR